IKSGKLRALGMAGLKRSEERINFLGPLLQGAARKIQDLLGTEAVATLRLVTRQYVDDNLQHLVEQYAREGTIDWGDAGIVIAGAIIPGSLPGGGGKPFKGKSKTTALPGKPKKPPGGSGGGGGGGGSDGGGGGCALDPASQPASDIGYIVLMLGLLAIAAIFMESRRAAR
ncbi:MAG: hypothetical protein HUU29_13325, partial [Planctomycetaceae bacterium]|nr:hypothetical protein [Planctomycetaceae bacterium]